MARKCMQCGADIRDGVAFCTECGAKAPETVQSPASTVVCTSCGAPMKEGSAFCTSCGAKQGAAAPVTPPPQPAAAPPPPPQTPPPAAPVYQTSPQQPVYQQPVQPAPQQSLEQSVKGTKYEPITTGGFIGIMLLLCIPAMVAGMKPLQALGSLLNANFGLPAYASGAPGLMNLVPRAIVEEMPQYAPILRHFDELDTVTHAQPYYTHAHFTQMASGMILVSLAFAMGMWALILRMKDRSTLHRLLTLALGLMIACPNTTSGAWLIVDLLCLYALLAAPKLRIPACMVLFATACSSVYPMTEEVMLPMIYAFALCLLALLMLTGVIPMNQEDGEEKAHE